MEQPEEIVIPEIEERPNKKRKSVLGIAAACIIVCIVVVVVVVTIYSDEKRALVRGIRNIAEEVQERQELTPENWPGNMKTETKLNFSIENFPVTLGVDTQIVRDADEHRMQALSEFSVMNMKLAQLEAYGDDDTLMLAVPAIWEENFAFDTKRIDEQYQDSLLEEKLGKIDNCPEISIDLFQEEYHFPWKELVSYCQENLNEFEIERVEEAVDIIIAEKDNRLYQCSQYRIVLPVPEMKEIGVMGVETEDFDEQMFLLVSVDENDRIVQIALDEPFSTAMGKLTGTVSFVGENRRIDDIIVNMQVRDSVSAAQLGISMLSDFGNEMTAYTVEVAMSAEAVYHEDDNSVSINLDKLTAFVSRLGTVKVNGSFTIEPLQEEITPPDRKVIRIFEMTEDEYEELETQFWKKLGWKINMASKLLG